MPQNTVTVSRQMKAKRTIDIYAMVEVLRIHQWVKNLLTFLPLVFAGRVADLQAWIVALLATLAFSLTCSAVYILNDILDCQHDRCHPLKKNRPIASGRLTPGVAIIEMVFLLATASMVSLAMVGKPLAFILAFYVALQVIYNIALKRRMLMDVICLACGFTLRAVAGCVAIRVWISPWLIICTFGLCLFLGFCKRQCEILTFKHSDAASRHRKTLAGYKAPLLNHLITLSGCLAIISFLLYATNEHTIRMFGTQLFVATLPIVFYGVCRIAMLCMLGLYSDPTELLLRDRPVQIVGTLWLVCCVVIVTWGQVIEKWLLLSHS